MKSLKKFSVIFLLIFSFTPLWAVENKKLDQFKETILDLYNSKMSIYKRILSQEVREVNQLLSEDEEFQKNSENLMSYISEMDVSEFKELFEEAWTNKNEEVKNSDSWKLVSDVNQWYHYGVNALVNYSEERGPTLARFIVLIADEFHPCSRFLDQNSEKQCNPYFWLLDEMIQFLLTEEPIITEKSSHILKCINVLLGASEEVPLAGNEAVQEFYCTLWLHEIFSEKKDLEKLEVLKRVFIQSENPWKKTCSEFFKDLKERKEKKLKSLTLEQKAELKEKLKNNGFWNEIKELFRSEPRANQTLGDIEEAIVNLIESSTIPTEEILAERGIDSDLSEIIIRVYNQLYRPLRDL